MLKSRHNFPPGGFQFVQPQTGWTAPEGVSFDTVVQALIRHRQANPAMVSKHGLAVDYASVAREVDEYNDARCRAHGWLDYVTGPARDFSLATLRSPSPGSASAAGASRIKAGIKTLLEWIGSGGRPVENALAARRAKICADCPLNGRGDWTRWFTVPASEAIRRQLALKAEMRLTTSEDESLGVCSACLCPLKLKVWCPLEFILESMDAETQNKLDPACWIKQENHAVNVVV